MFTGPEKEWILIVPIPFTGAALIPICGIESHPARVEDGAVQAEVGTDGIPP